MRLGLDSLTTRNRRATRPRPGGELYLFPPVKREIKRDYEALKKKILGRIPPSESSKRCDATSLKIQLIHFAKHMFHDDLAFQSPWAPADWLNM
jgi:hypothetical protein